jgi:hypothetical protein
VAHAALTDLTAKRRLQQLAIGAAWVVGTAAALRVVAGLLAEAPLAGALFGAVVAYLAARRAGVGWDEPSAVRPQPEAAAAAPRWRQALGRLASGAAVSASVLVVCVALGSALGWTSIRVGQPSTGLVPSTVRATAIAVRDELALRGLVLAACSRAGVRPGIAVVFAGLSGGAALALEDGSSAAAVTLAAATGCLFASLWRIGSGWAAIGAHAAWALGATALLRGALMDVEWSQGKLITGPRASGGAAWIGAACAAVAAVVVLAVARKRAARVTGASAAR